MIFVEESSKPVKLTKDFWIKKALEFEELRKYQSAKKFAEDNDLVYSTMTSSFSRYKEDIQKALKVKELRKVSPRNQTKGQRALMLINDFRSGMRRRAADGAAASNNKSQKWFEETLKSGVRGHKVSRPVAGKIYAFVYDAKHKDTLEYWDRFPLIIYLGDGVSKKGTKLMYGLNMHYIPPKARQQFLEELLRKHASTDNFTNRTKLKIDWSKVKGIRGSNVMIKSYLPGHVKTTFVEVRPKDWINIIFMPLQQFMSKGKRFSANSVWAKY